jgi:hypothetical protein
VDRWRIGGRSVNAADTDVDANVLECKKLKDSYIYNGIDSINKSQVVSLTLLLILR